MAIALYSGLSGAAWVFGVVNSAALWQTRLLFPVLLSLALPTALGWQKLKELDTTTMRISFIFNVLASIIIGVTIIDAGINVLVRHPLAYALGIESRQQYLEKVQPAYAGAIRLVEQIPAEAQVYAIFEPRTYYMPRNVHPDAILDNFAHDLYLAGSAEKVWQIWQEQGFTHVLLNRRGAEFLLENDPKKFSREQQVALADLIANQLIFIRSTPDGAYEIFQIKTSP